MNKFCIFPILNKSFWDMYKNQINAIWFPEELDFSQDYDAYLTLDEHKQHTIKMILAFFSNSDGLVNFNIQKNLLNDFDKEIQYIYVFQMFIEQIHNETYSIMIETLIKNPEEKNKLFNSLNEIEIIKEISEWGLKYSNDNNISLKEKILVFICFEGIMFSGAFAFIFWLKTNMNGKNKLMLGLQKSNEFIARDEGMHVEFGISVFHQLSNDIDKIKLEKIILECVELTKKFNNEVLQISQVGMNTDLMNIYTEYMADRIFVDTLGNKYFNVENPFSFMTTIGMLQKTNFHDQKPTEYKKSFLQNSEDLIFSDDF